MAQARITRNHLYLREGLLALGFVLLLAASTVSVLVPELGKEPGPEVATPNTEAAGTP
jgi:hypothetical protein